MHIYRHHLRALDRHHHAGHLRHVGPERQASIVNDVGEGATNLALGLIHGRYAGMPEAKLGSLAIPLDFAIALIAKLVQYLPFAKPAWLERTSDVVGRGALNYFAGSIGQALGQKWRAGSVGLTGGAPLNRAITQGSTPYDARMQSRGPFSPHVLASAVHGRA